MLGKLFGSKSRVKILKIFLLNPNEKYYIRQLSRDLGLQINSVRRELENLEQFGLLISSVSTDQLEEKINSQTGEIELMDSLMQKKKTSRKMTAQEKKKLDSSGNKQEKKYYQVNKDFVLFEEIKSLIVKAQLLYERDFIMKLEKVGKVKLLIFTGFFANNSLPIDLFVVGQLNKQKLLKVIENLEKDLGREVNFTVMNMKEFKFRRDMTDVFLYDILENKNIVVIDEIGLS